VIVSLFLHHTTKNKIKPIQCWHCSEESDTYRKWDTSQQQQQQQIMRLLWRTYRMKRIRFPLRICRCQRYIFFFVLNYFRSFSDVVVSKTVVQRPLSFSISYWRTRTYIAQPHTITYYKHTFKNSREREIAFETVFALRSERTRTRPIRIRYWFTSSVLLLHYKITWYTILHVVIRNLKRQWKIFLLVNLSGNE
jgi:hypothetical protein